MPLFPQETAFASPLAQRDSALAHELLERAQFYLDSAQTDAAIAAARNAEVLLRNYIGEADPRLSDAYCLLGLGLLRAAETREEAFGLWQKVEKMPLPANPLSRANVHYFVGTCHLYRSQFVTMDQEYQKALNLCSRLVQP